MVKIKNRRSLIYTIVMSLLLIISIASIATLAYFTSQKSTSKEIKFGTIEVDVTGNGGSIVTGLSENAVLMPGDTISVNFTVENKGEACYYLVLVSTPGASGIDIDLPVGLWAGDVNTAENKIDTPTATTYRVGSFAASTADSGKSFTYENEEMTFDLVATGNEMQGKSVNICVTVVAIQQANMANNAQSLTAEQYAYQELYKMLYPSEAVVVGGVKYFYQNATDSFKVGDSMLFQGPQSGTAGYTSDLPSVVEVEGIILGRSVTTIDSYAFCEATATKIILPESITEINNAFLYMSASSVYVQNDFSFNSGGADASWEIFPSEMYVREDVELNKAISTLANTNTAWSVIKSEDTTEYDGNTYVRYEII